MTDSALERELWKLARDRMHVASEYKDESGGYMVFVEAAMHFRHLAKLARNWRRIAESLRESSDYWREECKKHDPEL